MRDFTSPTSTEFFPKRTITDAQRVALGERPQTWAGWVFWLRHWSPPAIWWVTWRRRPR
jgi:hypothetical protein